MRRFLVLLALVALVLLSAQPVTAKAEKDDEVLEATVEATAPGGGGQPQLSPEAFAKIFEKLSNKCQKEIEANPTDPESLTPRCRSELGRKIQRHLEREKEGPKEKKQEKPKKETKPKKKKAKKQSRAQKEAAAAIQAEEDYYQTVKVIVGFVATLIAGVFGVTFVINRKLKAAGMYYPADPNAPATGCC